MAFLGSKVFYVFGLLPTDDCERVKLDLERAANSPNSILSVAPNFNVAMIYFMAETEDDQVLKTLKTLRRVRIVGKPCVLVFEDEILQNVRLILKNDLLPITRSNETVTPPDLYNDVVVFPVRQPGAYSRRVSMVEAKDWKAAEKFEEKLRSTLSGRVEAESSTITPIISRPIDQDDPTACTPLKRLSDKAWIIVKLSGAGVKYMIEIGPGDIFTQDVDVMIFPSKNNLQLHDAEAEAFLFKVVNEEYSLMRESFLEKKGVLQNGLAEIFPVTNQGRFQSIMHASVPEYADSELLYQAYRNCLLKAGEHEALKTLGFTPFLPEKLDESAEAAATAILQAIGAGELKVTVIKFVHHDRKIAQRFGHVFSERCNSQGTPTQKKGHYPWVNDDYGKQDLAIALPPKTEAAKAADMVAEKWLETIEVPETAGKRKKSATRQRPYAKRSLDEKKKRRARTPAQKETTENKFTYNFCRFLSDNFPRPDICLICDGPMSVYSDQEDSTSLEETEICLHCYRTYHIDCLDTVEHGTCPPCLNKLIEGKGDQLEGGRVSIEIKDEGESVPGYEDAPGHIEVVYSIPSGLQGTNHPKPGEFCFGLRRVAYLPNTKDGQRVAEMLRMAFEHGFVFSVGKSLSLWNDYGVIWGCIPHKTRLTGGRANCGFPDPTYLSRVEGVLKALGIQPPEPQLQE